MNEKKTFFSFNRLLLIFFLAILVSLISLCFLFYRNRDSFYSTSYWINHTRAVVTQAYLVSSLTKDLQAEYSRYILTGEPDALVTYSQIRESLDSNKRMLEGLTSDNPLQQKRVEAFDDAFNHMISFFDQSILLTKQKKLTESEQIVNNNQRTVFRYEINQSINDIITHENELLSIREAANKKIIDDNYAIFVVAGLIILLLIVGTFFSVVHHFRQRKKAESKVRESEARFRLFLNGLKDLAIFMVDPSGHILNWHDGATKLKGYQYNEVIGKHISIFYPKESVDIGEPEANLITAAKNGSYETEGWRVRKDQSRFWADILITAIYDESGELQGFIKVTRDYSLHRKAEEESERAFQKQKELNEMKSNFISITSHEFRTPLTTILSSLSLLEKYQTPETIEKSGRHINRIKSSVNELVAILEELLSLEKIEEGRVIAKKEPFNLKEFIEQLVVKLKYLLKEDQAIDYSHSGQEKVQSDAGFIEHVLTNLITNAVKYSAEGKHITLYSSVFNGKTTIGIRDQGIGISKEDQEQLFERFFRASNAGTVKGTGLGLHIVKTIYRFIRRNHPGK